MVATSLSRRHGQAGYTLIELMVVLVLLGVVGSVVTASSISALRAQRQSEARTYALTDIQKGLERVGRELRAAAPLQLDPSGNYSDGIVANVVRDGVRISYRYYLEEQPDGSVSLLEDVQRQVIATGATTSQNGLFIADIANRETGTPLFTYFATDPVTNQMTEIDCAALTPEVCTQRTATATQIRLTLEKMLPEQPPIQVQTTVNIRNTRLG